MKWLIALIIILSIVGIFDSSYLTFEHYNNTIPPCSTSFFSLDCGSVLRSSYAVMFGVPLALIGVIHYSLLTFFIILAVIFRKKAAFYPIVLLSVIGFVSSLYFVYLQVVVIGAICFYCMVSALNSILIFIVVQLAFSKTRNKLCIWGSKIFYGNIVKPIFFCIDPERIHVFMCRVGECIGKIPLLLLGMKFLFVSKNKTLHQTLAGIHFNFPVGLAAGFDYEARLTQTLPALGFGFETVGTITHLASSGNPKPRLGRLPKSRSLMVNKGFRNPGIKVVAEKLKQYSFEIPLGISIGRTNTKNIATLAESITDILSAFKVAETTKLTHSYYELNISCPNLFVDINFYLPKHLELLLKKVDALQLTRPVFIKMPIEKSDTEVLEMLAIIAKHKTAGVIFGNLQKDRRNSALNQAEVSQWKVGNFSGKPTFKRSNELIALTYKRYQKRFIIIGCGGIFTAIDAYEKITLGASLVQLITGMIYEGPQLIAQINSELAELLKTDGYSHISEAVGSRNKI